jgi:serine/threonine protein kinase
VRDPKDFRGTERFEILRRLGAGGMGTVYVARDRERNQHVALKTLHSVDATAILRFKNEFRDFQDLSHPHLVSLGELYSEQGTWFFTMELIEGPDFLEYVRPGVLPQVRGDSSGSGSGANGSGSVGSGPGGVAALASAGLASSASASGSGSGGSSLDTMDGSARLTRISTSHRVVDHAPARDFNEPRLRSALGQLADALHVLHEARKVHRDLKPSNVLVSHLGRVVLLDFGLATSLERDPRADGEIVGTLEYMAPEQAAGRDLGPPADLYGMGVMLYQALTGRVPITGAPLDVLMRKQDFVPPAPRLENPAVPEDLDELCLALLRIDPATRPTAAEVLERLGAKPLGPGPAAMGSTPYPARFIGRPRELTLLSQLYAAARSQAQTVCIRGESGLGKSALVRQFTIQLKAHDAQAVVLAGNCYERESIPFKAIDGVIDSLSQHLRALPKVMTAALLPRHATLLAQVFPVLGRVEAVAESPRSHEKILDPQKQRSRLFASLRELFARLADRRRVVLVIDDLQWADADSLALLSEVLCPPDAPRLLFIATVRTEGGADGAGVEVEPELKAALSGNVTHLRLERMSSDEASELAQSLVQRSHGTLGMGAEEIVKEAQGHPLFIDALVRYARAVGAEAQGGLSLDDALWAHINRLEPDAKRVLELVSLAVQRLPQQAAAQAAGVSFADLARVASLLRAAHLVRTSGSRRTDVIEPYHDRVRRAVLSHLTEAATREHHLRLAVALESTGQADPEALAIHWREARDAEKTAHFALLAALKAGNALAFDRAAQFYQLAIAHLPADHARLGELQIRLADALASAGRGGEAGLAYQQAALGRSGAESLDLGRRAAEQLLISGHIVPGLEALRRVLAATGMSTAETPTRAIARLLVTRARVRLRGLGFRERAIDQIAADRLTRIDVCWSAGVSLALVDSLGGATFQAKNLLLSLEAGEPYRIARALAMESAYLGLSGGEGLARSEMLHHKAAALAERVGNPHAIGLAKLTRGIAAFLQGRWQLSRESSEQAETIFRERCTGVTWEMDNAQLYPLWSIIFLGELGRLDGLASPLLAEARVRGDLYLETNLRTRVFNMIHLASDQPEAARADVERGMASWSHDAFHLQNYFAIHTLVEVDLYVGDHEGAYTRLEAAWAQIRSSGFWHVQMMRVESLFLRARCVLARARRPGADVAALHKTAEQAAKRLGAEKVAWAEPMALQVRGVLAAQRGRAAEASALLVGARDGFARADMKLHATILGRLAGELEAADAWMEAQGIRQPRHMEALYAPGFHGSP